MTSYQFDALMEVLRSIDDKLTDLVAQDRQELLKRIELPEYKTYGENLNTKISPTQKYIKEKIGEVTGYNQALQDCRAIINAIKGDN